MAAEELVTSIDVRHCAEELDTPITIGLFLDYEDEDGDRVVLSKDFSCAQAEALAFRILREIELYESHPRHEAARRARLVADVNASLLAANGDEPGSVEPWRCCEGHG